MLVQLLVFSLGRDLECREICVLALVNTWPPVCGADFPQVMDPFLVEY